VPEVIALFGLMEIGRALIMVLTPLAVPYDEATHFGLEGVRNWGEFPSGHAATFLLYYLIVDGDVSPRIKSALRWLLVGEIVALLVSHSHYSIDIVGGLLLAYWVHREYAEGRTFDALKRLVKV
jgi:membrane-associated phospholipid phosphatase